MDVTQLNVDELFQKSVVWDAHCGMDPQVPIDVNSLERIRKAGFTFVSTNAGYDVLPWHETFPVIAACRHFLKENTDKYVLVSSVADVLAAKRDGKLAVSMDIEGISALNGTTDLIETYHTLGVRQISFVYNKDNLGGGGCHGDNTGITPFGRDVVREMNRVGIIVDGTHCSPVTSIDLAETSSKPIVISHSNSRVLHDHPRNIWNEQALACANTGGVVGITGIRIFLTKAGDKTSDIDLLVRNIDHYCELIGPQHVGIGTDFAEITNALSTRFANATDYWPPEHYPAGADLGFVDIEVFPQLTAALSARGYSNKDISGILGGNFMRVAAANWE
ncbi:MAG: membrane dipeptidase [Mesorhizobium sp.]|uniref:dipeptidase n=1 Tax=Mesorhizobium sp. TaxID=1871066 RepID=UPI000FE78EF8|nr:membrane dipeptidase [Mesorhizobium sp.]RWD52283.1 MAG: membrane dipeptidase [Mesorhizobium sp.]RWE61946.1 MAG: membrane dipeptidase [Mesorhizobium sp.]RWF12112.1 MAG: membrane dipeptidase [Mesorhizobium sp.]RWF22403.1 MAG: membrane dipeptidase [Mesorhizobium sp.]